MGRPRKTNVRRDASGKSRGEEGIHPWTLEARERKLREAGVPLTFRKMEMTKLGWTQVEKRTASDRMSGFTLGILRLRGKGDPGGISEEQFNAGEGFCRIVHQHAAVMGYRLSVPSPSLMLIGLGGASYEDDADTIARVRRSFRRCFDALMEASRSHGKRVWQVTYGVCVENWSPGQLSAEDYGSLRTGLNVLRKVV